MKEENLKELLWKDFEMIFSSMDLFISNIPAMAKLIGVENFQNKMEMTKTQYYRRTRSPEKWSYQELIRAKSIFTEFGLGNKSKIHSNVNNKAFA